jgi:hypothetical protein
MVVGLPFFGPKEGRENDDSPMDLDGGFGRFLSY